jgi:hypothetical protein
VDVSRRRPPPPPDLDLHIERLVVRGLAPAHRERIVPALQAELARLLAEHGLPPAAARDGLRLAGGTFRAPRGARPEAIGETIARQLHAGWRGGED